MSKRLTTEEFIAKAKAVHGDKYDYSLVDYKTAILDVQIVCRIHGAFPQTPNSHLRGTGCPDCGELTKGASQRFDTNKFIEKAKAIHGDRYDYSLVDYKNNHTPVKIICSIHGVFPKKPSDHISKKPSGCLICDKKDRELLRRKKSLEKFVTKSRKIHGDKYDYSLVDYISSNKDVTIICPIHGKFDQAAKNHSDKQKSGCPSCSNYGYDVLKPSILYIYITNKFVGYGITCNITARNARHVNEFTKNDLTHELHKTYNFSGRYALELETSIKKHFDMYRIDTGIKGFLVENIRLDKLKDLTTFIDYYIKENPQVFEGF